MQTIIDFKGHSFNIASKIERFKMTQLNRGFNQIETYTKALFNKMVDLGWYESSMKN